MLKLVIISDTHGLHDQVKDIPEGDVLIHCGDISNIGKYHQIMEFLHWFNDHPHKHKIFIAGNHDWLFDLAPSMGKICTDYFQDSIIYLENSDVVIEGKKFYGSPIVPPFNHWAFNREDEERISYWEKIPSNTDVLITHGPPRTILDLSHYGNIHCGCQYLYQEVVNRIKPTLHCFGDIHEAYGLVTHNDTTFINASLLNQYYKVVNQPRVITI